MHYYLRTDPPDEPPLEDPPPEEPPLVDPPPELPPPLELLPLPPPLVVEIVELLEPLPVLVLPVFLEAPSVLVVPELELPLLLFQVEPVFLVLDPVLDVVVLVELVLVQAELFEFGRFAVAVLVEEVLVGLEGTAVFCAVAGFVLTTVVLVLVEVLFTGLELAFVKVEPTAFSL